MFTSCIDCGVASKESRCPAHKALFNKPRNLQKAAKQKAHGRNTQAWYRLRKRVLIRDGYTCRQCGDPAKTVHLDPRLNGRHDLATEHDCIALCLRCHGTIDGPRAQTHRPHLQQLYTQR